jgi:hypothetical protein
MARESINAHEEKLFFFGYATWRISLRIIANRPARAGMRKISTSTIFSVSPETTSSHDSGYASDDAYVEICEMMKSPETLIWLGFNEVIARDLWANYLEWYDRRPYGFPRAFNRLHKTSLA